MTPTSGTQSLDRHNGVAIVFPGQGCQKTGMGRDFHEAHPEARAVFEEASEALGQDLAALCFEPDERLGRTAWTQPAILTVEIAMFRTAQARYGLQPDRFGGHSLGEYTALVAAGVLPLDQAVRLVHERGRRMQEAVPEGEGSMAALLRRDLDPEAVGRTLQGLQVDVANHNSPDQVVLSGSSGDLDRALERLSSDPATQGSRARKLAVSAPFHSRLMSSIEPGFRALLDEASSAWQLSQADRVLSNFTGRWHQADRDALVDSLTRQISGTVRWVDNMQALVRARPAPRIEVGPGRPRRGFFRSLDTTVESITNTLTAQRVLATSSETS
ncbi:MAG: ACP S-malonyltransferase [Myxococcota bacterium]|nr:ACP S-malonyltransferase [Myxococcota bacterium]